MSKKLSKEYKTLVKKRKKRHQDIGEENLVFDMRGYLFTLSESDAHYEAPVLIKLIYSETRKGKTIDEICMDNWLFETDLTAYAEAHPEVGEAIVKANSWLISYGKNLLRRMARDKTSHSPTIAKILMSAIYGLSGDRQAQQSDGANMDEILKLISRGLPE